MHTVTILIYSSHTVPADVEVFTLWHGAEHRANDLMQEWGDIDNWIIEKDGDVATAVNANLGAVIVLRSREVQDNGGTS